MWTEVTSLAKFAVDESKATTFAEKIAGSLRELKAAMTHDTLDVPNILKLIPRCTGAIDYLDVCKKQPDAGEVAARLEEILSEVSSLVDSNFSVPEKAFENQISDLWLNSSDQHLKLPCRGDAEKMLVFQKVAIQGSLICSYGRMRDAFLC